MSLLIAKQEKIYGPSGSSVTTVISHVEYSIHSGTEKIDVSFDELRRIGDTINAVVKRDGPLNDKIRNITER